MPRVLQRAWPQGNTNPWHLLPAESALSFAAKVQGGAEERQPHTSSPACTAPVWPRPAHLSTIPAAQSRRVAKQLVHALGSLGVLFSSVFSFLQNSVNEMWVDFGADMDRDAHQASGRIGILKYV